MQPSSRWEKDTETYLKQIFLLRIEFILVQDPVADAGEQGNEPLFSIKEGQWDVQLSDISFPNRNLLYEIRLQTLPLDRVSEQGSFTA